jgi:hypothetical protein
MRFHWITQMRPVSGDAQRHIIFADVRQLSVDWNDILADFRCAEIMIDECAVSFDDTEALTRSVTVDLADLEWLIIALLLACEMAIQEARSPRSSASSTSCSRTSIRDRPNS